MRPHRFAILDPSAGISGDMILGALVDAGVPIEQLAALPAVLGVPDVTVTARRVERCGVSAVKVDVTLPGGRREEPAEAVSAVVHGDHEHSHAGHTHGHGDAGSHHHHGDGPHRHVGELITMIRHAGLSPWVTGCAVRAFELLGEAEGRVHGLAAADVPLHEVGAWDALVDIVGAVKGFEELGVREIYHWPVALGQGWVRAAHGVIPIPAPATMNLLEGIEIAGNGPVTGEATTPTGAALLRALSSGPPPSRWRVERSGWGAGGRDPRDYPNALRIILAEPVAEAAEVVMLATDIDDLTPEYLGPLREALVDAGALDVQVWPTHMKKGRTGFRLEITVGREEVDVVSDALFRNSTTAGLRRWPAER
ncbi:MAG: nickel pincer cofactor biosynthesis protein LarC, partial [Gemmatimonadales bacterium]